MLTVAEEQASWANSSRGGCLPQNSSAGAARAEDARASNISNRQDLEKENTWGLATGPERNLFLDHEGEIR